MRMVFIGASGHGKVCAEVAELNGYDEILFLDDDKRLNECIGYPIVGTVNEFQKYANYKSVFFISIGDGNIRGRIQEEIEWSNLSIATLVHPTSVVSRNSVIGTGTVIMAGSVINSGTKVEKGCIINTSSSIDHDVRIGSYSHIAVGAHICGTVRIGSKCWIGAGAIVKNNISICNDCIVGAGAVVVKDIKKAGTYIGMPARRIR